MSKHPNLSGLKVSINTGRPEDIYKGCLVTWLCVPRGGYGFTLPVHAEVERVMQKTVLISFEDIYGSTKMRMVSPNNLRWR